ncbi:hypothetical protein MW887_008649 [Aspergillus wentii]|nr:hypothetical protein MW887_008649 [Aspergillus wentii]
MQLNNIIATTLAVLAGTVAALPAANTGPFRMAKISIPSNSTMARNSTIPSNSTIIASKTVKSGTPSFSPSSSPSSSSRAWPKVMASNVANRTQSASEERKAGHAEPNMCPELCSLQAQSCVVALPDDEAFW